MSGYTREFLGLLARSFRPLEGIPSLARLPGEP